MPSITRQLSPLKSASNLIIRNEMFKNIWSAVIIGVRGTSVGIATSDGQDGSGIESRWKRDLPCPSRPFLGPTQPPVQQVQGPSWW